MFKPMFNLFKECKKSLKSLIQENSKYESNNERERYLSKKHEDFLIDKAKQSIPFNLKNINYESESSVRRKEINDTSIYHDLNEDSNSDGNKSSCLETIRKFLFKH